MFKLTTHGYEDINDFCTIGKKMVFNCILKCVRTRLTGWVAEHNKTEILT